LQFQTHAQRINIPSNNKYGRLNFLNLAVPKTGFVFPMGVTTLIKKGGKMNKFAIALLVLSFLCFGCEIEKDSKSDAIKDAQIDVPIPEGSEYKEWCSLNKNSSIPILDAVSNEIKQAYLALESGDKKLTAEKIDKIIGEFKSSKIKGRKQKRAVTGLEKSGKLLKGKLTEAKKNKIAGSLLLAYFADLSEVYVSANPSYWKALQKEVDFYSDGAKTAFSSGNKKVAAVDLRRNIIFLKMEAVRADQKSKDLLFDAVKGMSQLASLVEKSGSITPEIFDRYLSRGHQAMASSHAFQAGKKSSGKKKDEALIELQASLHHLKQAGELAKYKFSSKQEKAFTQAGKIKAVAKGKRAKKVFVKSLKQTEKALAILDKKTSAPG